MKIKNIIIIIIILSLFFAIRQSVIVGKRNDKNKYDASFEGIIVKKIRRRGDIVFFKDFATNKVKEIYATSELNNNSKIGDTIVKLANSNKCIIKSRSKEIIVERYYGLDF